MLSSNLLNLLSPKIVEKSALNLFKKEQRRGSGSGSKYDGKNNQKMVTSNTT